MSCLADVWPVSRMAWPQAHLEKEVLLLKARLECATHSCLYLPCRIQMRNLSHGRQRGGEMSIGILGGLGLDSSVVCYVDSRRVLTYAAPEMVPLGWPLACSLTWVLPTLRYLLWKASCVDFCCWWCYLILLLTMEFRLVLGKHCIFEILAVLLSALVPILGYTTEKLPALTLNSEAEGGSACPGTLATCWTSQGLPAPSGPQHGAVSSCLVFTVPCGQRIWVRQESWVALYFTSHPQIRGSQCLPCQTSLLRIYQATVTQSETQVMLS